jgi:hypothetical protein
MVKATSWIVSSVSLPTTVSRPATPTAMARAESPAPGERPTVAARERRQRQRQQRPRQVLGGHDGGDGEGVARDAGGEQGQGDGDHAVAEAGQEGRAPESPDVDGVGGGHDGAG